MPLLKNTATNKRLVSVGKILIYLVLFLVGIVFSQSIASLFPASLKLSAITVSYITNSVSILVIFVLTAIFQRYVEKKKIASLGFNMRHFKKQFWLGSFIAVLAMTLGFIILLITNQIMIEGCHFNLLNILSLSFMCIVTAFIEEISFRGYIQNNLTDNFGQWGGLIISSVLFTIVHSTNNYIALVSTLNIFLAGLLLGLLYMNKRNLWAPIGFHLFWNFTQSLLGYNVSGEEMPSVLILDYPASNLFNGGNFGFEGSVVCAVLLLIVIIVKIKKK